MVFSVQMLVYLSMSLNGCFVVKCTMAALSSHELKCGAVVEAEAASSVCSCFSNCLCCLICFIWSLSVFPVLCESQVAEKPFKDLPRIQIINQIQPAQCYK